MHVGMAIADPVRQEILVMLRDEPQKAGSIAERFAISRPAISRHLRVLRECGLVHVEVVGRERFYALDARPLAELDQWLEMFRELFQDRWSQRFDALDTEVHRARRDRRRSEHESRPSMPRPITQEGTA